MNVNLFLFLIGLSAAPDYEREKRLIGLIVEISTQQFFCLLIFISK